MRTEKSDATGTAGAKAPPAQYLTFLLGEEVFAMDIRTVREIIQFGPMTTVPLMPDFVRGVINLRGAVVPVIDLQSRFGRQRAVVGKKSCIVIFDAVPNNESSDKKLDGKSEGKSGERVELGLLVDAVSEVIEIGAESIEPPPNFGTSVRRDFICGIGKVAKRFVIILDPDKAFDVEEMATLCESAQWAEAA